MQIVTQNPIRGTVSLDIGGRVRFVDLDLAAIAVLWERLGENWSDWLMARFSGKPREVDGVKGREFAPISPADISLILFAGLATDREQNGIVETEQELGKLIGLGNFGQLQKALTRTVLASMGIPGEVVEVLESAARAPRKAGERERHSTGSPC